MKKLDEKIIEEEVELKVKKEDVQSPTSCNCCEALASSLSKTIELAQKNDHEEHHIETRYNFFNEKLLILIGLALTIPIVLLEMIVYPHSYYLLNLITLALATPVQIVLGRPFYIRFIRAIREKKGFTTDTLVVISTTVAYFYSLVTMIIGSHVQFFEASSSVLTIFTIGEYLESRILQTTTESIKNLLALRPKTAVVIRNDDGSGKEEKIINADNIIVGDIV